MTHLRKRWVILGGLLAGISVACFALTRDEIQTPQHTAPWLFGPPNARWTVTELSFSEDDCTS